MQKQEILKNYPDQEDKLLVSKLLDKIVERDTRNNIVATDFLNMHEKSIIREVLRGGNVQNYIFTGGFLEAEREVLILFPDKLEEEYVKTQVGNFIKIIRIILPKYNDEGYSHREYLGGIMKLGVKREKIGDIIVSKNGADILLVSEIAEFLKDELAKLTRFSKSIIEIKNISDLNQAESKTEEISIIVPSYRVDAIVSEVLRISRGKASDILDEERVFLNGVICKKGSKTVKIGDKITVRGKGRFEIGEELGSTKKDNVRLKIIKSV